MHLRYTPHRTMAHSNTQPGSTRSLHEILEAMPGLVHSACLELADHGVRTTGDFLATCATPSGRTRICLCSGLKAEQLEDCRIAAELLIIPELPAHAVPHLRAAGVDGLRDLATRHPTTLTELITRIFHKSQSALDAQAPLTGVPEVAVGSGSPGFFEVAAWIAYAAVLTSGDSPSEA